MIFFWLMIAAWYLFVAVIMISVSAVILVFSQHPFSGPRLWGVQIFNSVAKQHILYKCLFGIADGILLIALAWLGSFVFHGPMSLDGMSVFLVLIPFLLIYTLVLIDYRFRKTLS